MQFILVLASAALAAALPATTMTDMPGMVRRDDPMAGMAGMTTTAHHHPASTTAPMPATMSMSMMARDVAHGKKGNDEKKKSTSKAKMSMAAGKTMVVVADEPEATEAAMVMMARDIEHGKKGMDEKKVSTKAAVKATSAKAAAKATPVKASSKMSMAAGKTMVVLDDAPEATETAMAMMARDVEHGKKGNDEKKKVVSTKASAKATSKMSMAAGKTMVVLDEPEATETAMAMMARDVEHGKKGNDEKKKTTMKMPAGKTMIVLPAVATTFVKVQRDMTMAGMESMTMPASVMSAHHPASMAMSTPMAMATSAMAMSMA